MKTNRRLFMQLASGAVLALQVNPRLAAAGGITRDDFPMDLEAISGMDEKLVRVLQLASLAPSGHNTQPWLVKIIEPQRWILAADPARYLPAVDPQNRELLLSLGAFVENLSLAAGAMGYRVLMKVIATDAQAEDIMEIEIRRGEVGPYPLERLEQRRTVKKGYLSRPIAKADLDFIMRVAGKQIAYFPSDSQHAKCLAEGTIEANRKQAYRDDAQAELARWIRFSAKDAEKHRDGLTTASMEINGMAGWVVRNFMNRESVMKKSFREQTIDMIAGLVKEGAGWLVLTGEGRGVEQIVDAGRRFQRMALLCRERKLALHPMTQMLEEGNWQPEVNGHQGMIPQFILRIGYLEKYPAPVSLRRPVSWFVKQ